MIIVICLLKTKKSISLKSIIRNANSPTQFFQESISIAFSPIDSREVSLKGNGFDFSVDHNTIDKSEILNIHK